MISIVIPSLGFPDTVARAVKSCDRPTLVSEVVIVYQGPASLDELKVPVTQVPVRVVRSQPGLSRARNTGVDALSARVDIIGFLDDDLSYVDGALEHVVSCFADAGLGFVSGVVIGAESRKSRLRFPSQSTAVSQSNVWRATIEGATLYRASAVRDCLGFDVRLGLGSGTPFGSGEGTDLALRVLAAGWRGLFCPEIVVVEEELTGEALPIPTDKHRAYAAGTGAVVARNSGGAGTVLFLAKSFGKIGLLALRFDPRGAWVAWVVAWARLRGAIMAKFGSHALGSLVARD